MTLHTVAIKEICEVFDGPHATPPPADEGAVFLGIKNISEDGHLDLSEIRYVSEQDYPRWIRRVKPEPGDIVFTYEATLHRYAIIPEGFRGCLGRRVALLRLNGDAVNSRYLFYYFRSPIWRATVESKIITGATVDRIPIIGFPDFTLQIPSLSEQEKIAEILSNYDRLIDNNTRRIALLEKSIHRLYKEWFVYLRFPGCDRVKVVDGVPEEWNRKPLESVCELVMGQSPPSTTYNTTGQGLPFHQGVTKFGSRFISHDTYCTQPNRIADSGDILCSVRAPVGRLNMTLDKIIIGRGLAAIRNRQGYQSFQFYQLKAHFFQEDLIGSGTIFASVTKKQLSEQMMLIPSEPVLQAFESISKPVDQQLINLHLQNEKLREARDLLLPRLMDGSIPV